MASSNVVDLTEDPDEEAEQMTRGELQAFLISNGCKTPGSLKKMRQVYVETRKRELGMGAAAAATTPTKAISSDTKKRPPSVSSPKPEKRLKRFRPSCSAATRQRIDRARTQRLYLVESPKPAAGDSGYEFVIMGSTGNLYTVGIGNLVHCTCPDHAKGNVCKHILFVMLKVIGLDPQSSLLYQAALLQTELKDIFAQLQRRMATVGRQSGVMANASVQKAYQELTSPDSKKAASKTDNDDEEGGIKRQPIEGDCPICFDAFANESLVWCKAMCGANFHTSCMINWKRNARGGAVGCPNCRTPWQDDCAATKTAMAPEGYTNLGRLQGQSTDRDTSTYSEWQGYRSGGRKRRWR